jgi:hypothetical protein
MANQGVTIVSIATLGIMTLSIARKNLTLGITTVSVSALGTLYPLC